MDQSITSKKDFNVYDYVFSLEEQIRVLQHEKHLTKAKAMQLDAELKKVRKELEELKMPPYMVGVVQEILDNEAIVKNSNGIEFLIQIPQNLKDSLLSGVRVALTQRNLTIMRSLGDVKDPRARAMEIIKKPDITFTDVGGLSNEIRELEETVILPLTSPEIFERIGIDSPKGILLHGAPGTGKTLLAKAIANKSNATFIGITASELVRKYIGEGAKLVRDVFKVAKEQEQAVIFIDEIDAIGAHRLDGTSGGDREVQRTLMQLLGEMDGFHENKNVKIIGATNRIDILDPALLRPGRFDRIINVPLPDEKSREQIFKIHSKKMKTRKLNYEKLVKLTKDFNGADIKSVCMEAGMFALREKAPIIKMEHFLNAITKVRKEEVEESPEAHKRMFN